MKLHRKIRLSGNFFIHDNFNLNLAISLTLHGLFQLFEVTGTAREGNCVIWVMNVLDIMQVSSCQLK